MLCYILKDSDSFFSFFIIEETQGTKYIRCVGMTFGASPPWILVTPNVTVLPAVI